MNRRIKIVLSLDLPSRVVLKQKHGERAGEEETDKEDGREALVEK